MDTSTTGTSTRETAIKALAVVGFVALIVASMWLAVYSTRFVPEVADRIGTAAVYLGSIFSPAEDPSLSVVPTASTTIPFGTTASSSTSTNTGSTTGSLATTGQPKPTQTTPGPKTNTTYPLGGASTATPSGLPDLTISVNAVGYLTTCTSSDSFVTSSTVPGGDCPAVRFTIKNIGTNWTGTWRFSATIPTRTRQSFESDSQPSLAPGDSIEYTLGFDQAVRGSDQVISIIANFDHTVTDLNSNNNNASAQLTIL